MLNTKDNNFKTFYNIDVQRHIIPGFYLVFASYIIEKWIVRQLDKCSPGTDCYSSCATLNHRPFTELFGVINPTPSITTEIITIISMIILFYCVGHINSAFTTFFIDKLLFDKVLKYPYKRYVTQKDSADPRMIDKVTNSIGNIDIKYDVGKQLIIIFVIAFIMYCISHLLHFSNNYDQYCTHMSLSTPEILHGSIAHGFMVTSGYIMVFCFIYSIFLYFVYRNKMGLQIVLPIVLLVNKIIIFISSAIEQLFVLTGKLLGVDTELNEHTKNKLMARFVSDFGAQPSLFGKELYWLVYSSVRISRNFNGQIITYHLREFLFNSSLSAASFVLFVYFTLMSEFMYNIDTWNSTYVKPYVLGVIFILFVSFVLFLRSIYVYYNLYNRHLFRTYAFELDKK